MHVYVVSLTLDNKWHCFDLSGDIPMYDLVGGVKYYEEIARKLIRDLVNGSRNYWHTPRDQHIFACAAHAPSPYQAKRLARKRYEQHLLGTG